MANRIFRFFRKVFDTRLVRKYLPVIRTLLPSTNHYQLSFFILFLHVYNIKLDRQKFRLEILVHEGQLVHVLPLAHLKPFRPLTNTIQIVRFREMNVYDDKLTRLCDYFIPLAWYLLRDRHDVRKL